MMVLSRRQGEKIIIGDSITIVVDSILGDKVKLGIVAPKHVSIHREEVYLAIQRERQTPPTARPIEEESQPRIAPPPDTASGT